MHLGDLPVMVKTKKCTLYKENMEEEREISTRAATMAHTRSRSREALEAIKAANPRRRIAVLTACTWPCGRELRIAKADRCRSMPPLVL